MPKDLARTPYSKMQSNLLISCMPELGPSAVAKSFARNTARCWRMGVFLESSFLFGRLSEWKHRRENWVVAWVVVGRIEVPI